MRYRKKAIIIEAFQYRMQDCPDWFMDRISTNEIITHENSCSIHTLEGVMTGMIGDYIIKGIKGEVYPCKSDVFHLTYEEIIE